MKAIKIVDKVQNLDGLHCIEIQRGPLKSEQKFFEFGNIRKLPHIAPINLSFTMQTQLFRIEGQQPAFQKKLSLVRLSKASKMTNSNINRAGMTVSDAIVDLARYYGSESLMIECPFERIPGLVAVCKLSVEAESSAISKHYATAIAPTK